jgi:large subunit ribosomal protein L19
MDPILYVHQQLNAEKPESKEIPKFKAGDNIIVSYKIVEGDKVRVQDFRGDVIQINGHGHTKSFTVRKISNGVGVERIFPFECPNVDEVTVTKRGRVRRAKLYYLRNMVGKKARIKELKTVR